MSDSTAFTLATILAAAFGGPLWAIVLLGILAALSLLAEWRAAR